MTRTAPLASAAAPRVAGVRKPLLVGLLLATCASLAPAQTVPTARATPAAEAGQPWAALTVSQQQALAPLKAEWSSIDALRKQKWLDVAARMPGMPAADRDRIQQRMTEWVRMSPAERGRARVQFQEARRLPAEQRQERWQAYQALPSDQRQALMATASQNAAKKPTATDKAGRPATPAASRSVAAAPEAKRNIVPVAPAVAAPKSVAPTVVQSRPGATTSLVTTRPTPPLHHQAGLPKVNASAGFVDPETLLPRRGPQGAAALTTPQSATARP